MQAYPKESNISNAEPEALCWPRFPQAFPMPPAVHEAARRLLARLRESGGPVIVGAAWADAVTLLVSWGEADVERTARETLTVRLLREGAAA